MQAAAGGGYVVLAVIQAVLAGVLAGVTVLVRSRRAQQGYIAARLKAERMRSELYLFLGRVGHDAGPRPADRLQQQSTIYADAVRAVHAAARPVSEPDASELEAPPLFDVAELVRRVEMALRQEHAQWGQLTTQVQITDGARRGGAT